MRGATIAALMSDARSAEPTRPDPAGPGDLTRRDPHTGERPLRVAYTLEQCWHRVPGGTASSALAVARELISLPGLELVGVAGRHSRPPHPSYRPPIEVRTVPLGRPWLYETWLRLHWPKVEAATGPVDVVHATGLIPAACDAPQVVTVHDVAFLQAPEQYTKHGVKVMRRAVEMVRKRATLVLCPSRSAMDDCADAGIDPDRIRLIPLGASPVTATPQDAARVRESYGLPSEFVLFVGTIEPRKNLRRLTAAVAANQDLPLVVVGPDGWGDGRPDDVPDDMRFLGFVPDDDLPGLYAAASVFAYPSEREGFGLPILDAMAQGTPVVTSSGTSTEEVAGGAAVLVDPFDVEAIAAGLSEACGRRDELSERGRQRAAEMTWERTADLTLAAYREAIS